jgi:hypothetical protein
VFDIVALGFVKVVAFDVLRFVKLILLVPLAEATFVVIVGFGIVVFVIPLVVLPALPTANALWRVPFPMPFTAIIIDVATMIDKYVRYGFLKLTEFMLRKSNSILYFNLLILGINGYWHSS